MENNIKELQEKHRNELALKRKSIVEAQKKIRRQKEIGIILIEIYPSVLDMDNKSLREWLWSILKGGS